MILPEIQTPEDLFLAAVRARESSRPRNRQTAIGPSSLGGCRARVWLQLQGVIGDNPTKQYAAAYGTAIHSYIEKGLAILDPWGDRFLREVSVSRDGMGGSCDLFDQQTGGVIDWKSSTKKGLGFLKDGSLGSGAKWWPKEEQFWQIQTYGWMLEGAGHEVRTVSLVGLARDGDEDSIRVETRPYDPAVALQAQEWLADVAARDEQPGPERPASFCRSYCPYWGGSCPGL
jgi:hypothetical protein